MQRNLIIALVLAFSLIVSGIASAAPTTQFVDVPAKHWAYVAVQELARIGIVDGYGDGTFRGDKTMTRYEMAQIVEKAMANSNKATAAQKALIDKLAIEFALELNKLTDRVAKLEKSQPNAKWSGNVRLRWVDKHEGERTPFQERIRLNVNANINSNTSFFGRLESMNNNDFGSTAENDQTRIIDAALTTKNPFGLNLTATYGRFSQSLQTLGYFVDTDGMVDGLVVNAGNKVEVTAGYADFGPMLAYDDAYNTVSESGKGEAYFAEASYDTSKATNIKATIFKGVGADITNLDVKGLSFSSKVAKDFVFTTDYIKNSAYDTENVGWAARLAYKGAKRSTQGTWGAFIEYDKFQENCGTDEFGGLSGASIRVDNIKAITLGGDYTVAKNIVIQGWYQFNAKAASDNADEPNRTRIQAVYSF